MMISGMAAIGRNPDIIPLQNKKGRRFLKNDGWGAVRSTRLHLSVLEMPEIWKITKIEK